MHCWYQTGVGLTLSLCRLPSQHVQTVPTLPQNWPLRAPPLQRRIAEKRSLCRLLVDEHSCRREDKPDLTRSESAWLRLAEHACALAHMYAPKGESFVLVFICRDLFSVYASFSSSPSSHIFFSLSYWRVDNVYTTWHLYRSSVFPLLHLIVTLGAKTALHHMNKSTTENINEQEIN